jgi:Tfp pilus assembly protein PilX
MTITHIKSRASQRGAVLVTGLIILAILLLLSAGAVMVSNTQFKVSGNMQFQTLAMSNAENTLATAENWLQIPGNAINAGFITAGTAGLYPTTAPIDPLTMTWDDTTSIKIDGAGNQRYAIELYMPDRTPPTSSVAQCNAYGQTAPCPKVNLYRVSARGISALGAAKIVQSLYAVRTTN